MEVIVRFVIWLIVTAIWSVIGLLFWLAILARTVGLLSFQIMATMLGPANSKDLSIPSAALNFYSDGFVKVFNSVFRGYNDDYEDDNYFSFNWVRAIFEVFWGGIFWLPIIYLLHKKFDIEIIENIWKIVRIPFVKVWLSLP